MSTGKIKTKGEFLQSIGMNETGVYQVKNGQASFTLDHFFTAGKKYGINMNWFFGIDNNMFAERKKRSALSMLKESVLAIELLLNGKG